MSPSTRLAIAIAAVIAATSSARAGTYQREELVVDGVSRELFVYTPNHLPPGPQPVVLAFHGFLSDASGLRWIAKIDRFADAAGFIVIYPNAVDKSWNAGRGSGSTNRTTDDLAFARALLASTLARPEVDPNRIYAMGFSNGAQMVTTIVCMLENPLAAAAIVAHSLNIPGCDPRRRVPMLVIQGRKDPFVPFEGGGKSQLTSHHDTVEFFRRVNEAVEPPATVVALESITCTRSDDRDGNEQVLECVGERDGHTWPGGVAFKPELFGATNRELSGTEFVFSFFSRHLTPAPLRVALPLLALSGVAPPHAAPPHAALPRTAWAGAASSQRVAPRRRRPATARTSITASPTSTRTASPRRFATSSAPLAGTASSPGASSPTAASPRAALPTASSPRAASLTASSPRAALASAAAPTAASLSAASPTAASTSASSPRAASSRTTSAAAASPRAASTSASSPRAALASAASPTAASLSASSPRAASPTAASTSAASPTAASTSASPPRAASSRTTSAAATSPRAPSTSTDSARATSPRVALHAPGPPRTTSAALPRAPSSRPSSPRADSSRITAASAGSPPSASSHATSGRLTPARRGAPHLDAAPERLTPSRAATLDAPLLDRATIPHQSSESSAWSKESITLADGTIDSYIVPRNGLRGATALVLIIAAEAARPDAVATELGLDTSNSLRYAFIRPELARSIDRVAAELRQRSGGFPPVLVVGIGPGGAVAQRLYCERGDLVSAVVMIAAGFQGKPCTPRPQPSLLLVQSSRDTSAPADGDPRRGLMSQADMLSSWRSATGIPLDPDLRAGPGYACQGGQQISGQELLACRTESTERNVLTGSFEVTRIIAAFLDRHSTRPTPYTIIHAH